MVDVNEEIKFPVVERKRRYQSFGGWRYFVHQPTQVEIDQSVFEMGQDIQQFIKENGWEGKSFSKTVVVHQEEVQNESLSPPRWIVALRFDEVVNGNG